MRTKILAVESDRLVRQTYIRAFKDREGGREPWHPGGEAVDDPRASYDEASLQYVARCGATEPLDVSLEEGWTPWAQHD